MIDYKLVQQEYHVPMGAVYANTSSCGLVAKTGVKSMHQFMLELHESGSLSADQFLAEDLPRIRKKIAGFVDAQKNELALIPNFSFGLNAAIPVLRPFRKVLLLEHDYPSLTQPFVLNDFEITWISSDDGFSFDLDKIEQAIQQQDIRIVAVSQVQYLSGHCLDIEALGKICRRHNAILLVDGTQSLGAIPFSFAQSDVDIFISSNYKWMNGGFGTGIMMMKTDFIQEHEPRIGGFASFLNKNGTWKYAPSIQSYEPGHLNMGGFLVLEQALDFKLKLGLENIYAQNKALLDILVAGLKTNDIAIKGPYSNENRTGILCLSETLELTKSLDAHQIVYKARNGSIRLGLHFHNTREDVEVILQAILKAVPEG
jgi:cysteine desulfurase/selenocysteine lyase